MNSSVGSPSTSHAANLGSNPVGALTLVTHMRGEDLMSNKSHIAPVSLTGWHIMISTNTYKSKMKYIAKPCVYRIGF